MRKVFLVLFILPFVTVVQAQSWDHIKNSGDYYYGIAEASTQEEASQKAVQSLIEMIADETAGDFAGLKDTDVAAGLHDHKSVVSACLGTYAPSIFNEAQSWVSPESSKVIVRYYLLRSHLDKIFKDRIALAKDMLANARSAEADLKIDMALEYNYWAYALINSVQYPDKVKNEGGKSLVKSVSTKIQSLLKRIEIAVDSIDGNYIDLSILYNKIPVSSLDYNYSDGKENCLGCAKDGRGTMELVLKRPDGLYPIEIEYQYLSQARCDVLLSSVLSLIRHKMYTEAGKVVKIGKQHPSISNSFLHKPEMKVEVKPENNALGDQIQKYERTINRLISTISSRRHLTMNNKKYEEMFTENGRDVFKKLIAYGNGRIVGTPDLRFSKGYGGTTMVRGLQMSFSFANGKKKTFVEDVVFTLNADGLIENIAFGLGKVATDDILGRYAPGWTNDTREMLIGFLENYKTAYCLKRYDYIESIFADDAIIIVGNMVKRCNQTQSTDERSITVDGEYIITHNKYDKKDYLERLKRCFDRNEFINLRFSNNDIQRIEKYKNEDLYGIQIGQEYNSSSYSDKGYLFLLVDMTKREEPLIRIRTWQPNKTPMKELYNAGDFYN